MNLPNEHDQTFTKLLRGFMQGIVSRLMLLQSGMNCLLISVQLPLLPPPGKSQNIFVLQGLTTIVCDSAGVPVVMTIATPMN